MGKLAEEVEDTLEYLVLKKVFSSYDDQHKLQLERVLGKISMIAGKVEKIKEDTQAGADPASSCVRFWAEQLKCIVINTKFYFYCKTLATLVLEWIRHCVQGGVDSSARRSSSASAPSNRKDATVGFEYYVKHVKERLYEEERKLQVIPICGMGGIGKTTLARNVYGDPLIMETFYIRVWVTVSQDYSSERIFSSLLDSLKEFDTDGLGVTDMEKVYKILKFRKYLVVMDDIWSTEAWDVVRHVFPNDRNGIRILLTTRLSSVASYPDSSSKPCEMQLMDEDQSWTLFKRKVFEHEDCPGELENIGKQIARSCKGLPLTIVVIAGVVSTVSRNLASWQEIEKHIKSVDQQNRIQDILALSYFHLLQNLRPCFLYMGSFPEDEEIKATKLIRLSLAESFLKSRVDSQNFEKMAEECLEALVKRNLVLVTKRKWDGRIKSCCLHDMLRGLCIRIAKESKFFLNLMDDRRIQRGTFIERIKDQRRLNLDPSNVEYLSSSNNSTIHSIKCSKSKYYRVGIDFLERVKLLRVLDPGPAHLEASLSMEELAGLFHLRYLAVGYSHDVSVGLWNFHNLQTLIIHIGKRDDDYHLLASSSSSGGGRDSVEKFDDLLLPWCMPHLRHVHFPGDISFSDPKETTCSLENLQTVSYVSHESCTERILKKFPNLKKLKVDCSHNGKAACLNNLVHLHQLESLELCALRRRTFPVRPKFYTSNFPKTTLKKLILRDLELPLKDFMGVGWLPNLQVLKIKGCTCLGEFWETTEGEFPQLEFLLIDNFSFTNWITESSHFPRLRRLSVSDCRHLDTIPTDIGEIPTLELIEITGFVKKSLVKSANEIQKKQEYFGNYTLQVICSAN